MTLRDEYGYPLTDVFAEGFLPPAADEGRGDSANSAARAVAYGAYQERFRLAYMGMIEQRHHPKRPHGE